MSTVSGPSPSVTFGIGDGIGASLTAGHVLKIAKSPKFCRATHHNLSLCKFCRICCATTR